jgi:GNAT superfamily N-acetyltransferase
MNNASPVSLSLAQALMDDPFYQAVTIDSAHDAEKRNLVLAQYIDLAIAEAGAVGEVQYAGDDGAAIWLMNEVDSVAAEKHYAAKVKALSALLGEEGFNNYLRICESMSANLPAELEGTWYLSILGMQSAARGKGLGQRLLETTLKRADAQHATSFLETFNPLSLPFYRRVGFTQEIPCIEPVTNSEYWIMVRPAK